MNRKNRKIGFWSVLLGKLIKTLEDTRSHKHVLCRHQHRLAWQKEAHLLLCPYSILEAENVFC